MNSLPWDFQNFQGSHFPEKLSKFPTLYKKKSVNFPEREKLETVVAIDWTRLATNIFFKYHRYNHL